jgi:hypothetical protein
MSDVNDLDDLRQRLDVLEAEVARLRADDAELRKDILAKLTFVELTGLARRLTDRSE